MSLPQGDKGYPCQNKQNTSQYEKVLLSLQVDRRKPHGPCLENILDTQAMVKENFSSLITAID